MIDEDMVANEITRESRALQQQVDGPRGVMAYLTNVDVVLVVCCCGSVDFHNRRQEEDKCWMTRRMERNVDALRDKCRFSARSRSKSRSRDEKVIHEKKRRRSGARSRSRSKRWQEDRRSPRRSRSSSDEVHNRKREDRDERSYWAQKKAEKSTKIWEDLYSKGTVSTENAPAFGSESESSDDDVKPAAVHLSSVSERRGKKQMKKIKKRDEKQTRKRKDDEAVRKVPRGTFTESVIRD
uniref:Uncharacterized protein n=1 Tax=Hyaloperonospora arabidopsidis (strain Emoy2) TaxID=559515 RepID=M4BRX1_HYAAE